MNAKTERIPCTMCHGVWDDEVGKPVIPNWTALTRSSFERKMGILSEMGVKSIGYGELEQWYHGAPLSGKRIMIDFDHAVRSIFEQVFPILRDHGLKGNMFVDTARVDTDLEKPESERGCMTWAQLGRLAEAGWTIGSHTVHHYSLATVEAEDPTGGRLMEEMVGADDRIKAQLGITPRDFAYTGTGWSPLAENIASQRYRFSRLWITGEDYTDPLGNAVPISHLMTPPEHIPACDEPDGGPPYHLRYITRQTNPHRLPSMELEYLIASDEAFRHYIAGP
jgi:peptidoglycan/xylan/chitin deacetylase (PgdA/CDA1 family)